MRKTVSFCLNFIGNLIIWGIIIYIIYALISLFYEFVLLVIDLIKHIIKDSIKNFIKAWNESPVALIAQLTLAISILILMFRWFFHPIDIGSGRSLGGNTTDGYTYGNTGPVVGVDYPKSWHNADTPGGSLDI